MATYAHGTPDWVDIGSPDIDASAAFYGGLFGWTTTEPGPVEETGGYRMFLKDGRWAVYDVSIEGIGLIGIYRTQFNAVIQRSGYPDLVAKLKAKQDERPGARDAGRFEPAVPTAAVVKPRESP